MKCEIAGYLLEFDCREEWIHHRFKDFLSKEQSKATDIFIEVLEEDAPIIIKKQDRISYSGTGTPLYHINNQWCFTWQEERTIPFLAVSSQDWKETTLYVKKESIEYLQKTFPTDWLLRVQIQLLQAVMQAFRYGVLSLGGIYIHGILAEYKGVGIGFSAASGTGKTTHLKLWKKAGYPITVLNGDNLILRRIENTVYAYGIPWCGSSEQYINKKIVYWGTVFLERYIENSVSLLNTEEGYFQYLQRSFLPRFDKSTMEKGLNKVEQILLHTNNYGLKCKPEEDAAKVMKDKLDQEFTNSRMFDKITNRSK